MKEYYFVKQVHNEDGSVDVSSGVLFLSSRPKNLIEYTRYSILVVDYFELERDMWECFEETNHFYSTIESGKGVLVG